MRRTLRPARFIAAASLVLASLAFAGLRAQESSAPGPGVRAVVERIERDVLAPAIDEARGSLSLDTLEERSAILRGIWKRVEDAAAGIGDVRSRAGALDLLEERFGERLADALAGSPADEAAREASADAVAAARALHRDARRIHLFDTILCKCDKERWTRTLTGCFEVCADAQKGWITGWLEEGYTDAEIRELMVERVGSDEVLFGERNPLTAVVPYAIFIAAFLVGGLLLWAVRRRPRAEAGSRGDRPAEGELDPEWEARLERELEETGD